MNWFKKERKKLNRKQREREITCGQDVCNLSSSSHNIIGDKIRQLACYFSDDIYPSSSIHLHSLPICQSLHHSHIPPEPTLSRTGNQLSYQHVFPHPVAFQHLPWIWNSWCRLHSWLQNCRLPFAMWTVGRCNQGPVARRSLFSLWVKIATGKWKTVPHFLSATAAVRYQSTKCSSGDTYRSALDS